MPQTREQLGWAATAALAGPAESVQLLPLGEVRAQGHDGRAPWIVRDAAAIVRASLAGRDALPIDYDHQTDFTRKSGNAAPAAGWIVALAVRDDGIYGRVEWTERGRAALAAREYRFLSPVFLHDRATREIKRILRAGLTNDPALTLKAVASAEAAQAETAAASLSATERDICWRMNLDPRDFAATRDGPESALPGARVISVEAY